MKSEVIRGKSEVFGALCCPPGTGHSLSVYSARLPSEKMSTSASPDWYENIEVFSSDYEPGTFEAGPSVETNHALLGGLRENDFEITDSAYTVRETCAASFFRPSAYPSASGRMAGYTTHSSAWIRPSLPPRALRCWLTLNMSWSRNVLSTGLCLCVTPACCPSCVRCARVGASAAFEVGEYASTLSLNTLWQSAAAVHTHPFRGVKYRINVRNRFFIFQNPLTAPANRPAEITTDAFCFDMAPLGEPAR